MMPSLWRKRYVHRVWTSEAVSLEMARGVISESRLSGMAFHTLFSRMVMTCEGCSVLAQMKQMRFRADTYLEVDVLQSPHDDAVQWLLWKV